MPPADRTEAIRKRPTTLGGMNIASLAISGALVLAYGLFGRWGEAQPDVFVSYWHQLLQASPLCFAFMVVAVVTRGVTITGAVAGLVIAVILRARFGSSMLVTLIVVFALTWAATRFDYYRKMAAGLAESRAGRNGLQVLANLAPAAALAIFYPVDLAVVAILGEVAADTVASEIGQAFGGQPRLITSLRPVSVGSNGGVTWLGTVAGVVAATAVVLAALLGRNFEFGDNIPVFSWWSFICLLSAAAGMFVDSFLGATLERKVLNNNAVNFISASFAALIAIVGLIARLRL